MRAIRCEEDRDGHRGEQGAGARVLPPHGGRRADGRRDDGRRDHLVGAAVVGARGHAPRQGQGARADGEGRRPLPAPDEDPRRGDGRGARLGLRAARRRGEDGEGPPLPQRLPLRLPPEGRPNRGRTRVRRHAVREGAALRRALTRRRRGGGPVELGIAVRSMGPQSRPEVLLACVRAAERAGLADVWVQDHVAIPPDDAEGSGGRYLDPLTALAWLAGQTSRIGLGTGVLILPYRPALPTAKAVATVQELSGGRLRLGVGVGWMEAEFRPLGLPGSRRGGIADATLELLLRCFAADVANANGQDFLFLPRPQRPPVYVGGSGEPALRRAVRFGDGWMPMTGDPAKLAPQVAR